MEQVEDYARLWREAGSPQDQVVNFLRAGVVLQPKQMAASAAARECDREDGPEAVGVGGARGGGKSHWMMAQIGADDCQRFPGLKALILRKVGKAGEENFQDLAPKTFGNLNWEVTKNGIRFPSNGSQISIGHFKDERDIDNYLGIEYDVIGIEESTTLSDSKHTAIDSCLRTSKKGWRPRRYETTNPGGIGHARFKREFVAPWRIEQAGGPKQTETRFIPATVDDNAHLNPGYKKKLGKLKGWLLRAWRFGDWDIASGQYFTTWNEKNHVARFDHSDHWSYTMSLDYGFTHHTFVLLAGMDDDGNMYVIDEHYRQRTLVRKHCELMDEMLDKHGIPRNRIEHISAGKDCFDVKHTGGTVAQEYAKHGFFLSPGSTDRVMGAQEILRRLGDPGGRRPEPQTLWIHERCGRLIECLPNLQNDPIEPERVKKWDCNEEGEGGDDPYDSLRYLLMKHQPGTGERAAAAPQPWNPRSDRFLNIEYGT